MWNHNNSKTLFYLTNCFIIINIIRLVLPFFQKHGKIKFQKQAAFNVLFVMSYTIEYILFIIFILNFKAKILLSFAKNTRGRSIFILVYIYIYEKNSTF
jgi:hypothetical protein